MAEELGIPVPIPASTGGGGGNTLLIVALLGVVVWLWLRSARVPQPTGLSGPGAAPSNTPAPPPIEQPKTAPDLPAGGLGFGGAGDVPYTSTPKPPPVTATAGTSAKPPQNAPLLGFGYGSGDSSFKPPPVASAPPPPPKASLVAATTPKPALVSTLSATATIAQPLFKSSLTITAKPSPAPAPAPAPKAASSLGLKSTLR